MKLLEIDTESIPGIEFKGDAPRAIDVDPRPRPWPIPRRVAYRVGAPEQSERAARKWRESKVAIRPMRAAGMRSERGRRFAYSDGRSAMESVKELKL
jgi:hypothetical protein